jgi:hypothetical protein
MSTWWRLWKHWLGGAETRPPPPPPPVPDDGAARATARRQGEKQFMDAVEQNSEVHRLAGRLRAQRLANDWGRLIEKSWEGRHGES